MKLIGFIFLVLFCEMAFMTFTRDVCILGAGASGMSAAVFLKDKGYDVLVIEKDEHVGGHCESHYFTPPTPGQPNWVELGVQVFPDTALENATGIGSWTLSSRAFAQRFLPPASTIPYVSNIQNYGFDFIRNFYAGPLPNAPVTQDYIDTFIRFNTILATRYPWLENVHFPDPIPPELLQPFGTFIDANNLTAIDSFFYGLLYFGGMGPQRNVTTLYALQNLRRGINILYSAPEYGFAIKGGCSKIYNGIATFLNGKNVHVQSTIQRVERLRLGPREQDWISTIFYTRKGYPGLQVEKCRNLIVAFPQLLNQMNFIDIYPDERAIFKDVRANFYYRYGVNANGPITTGPYSVVSLDLVNANRIPPLPNILTIRREYTYGPSVGNAYAETDISNTTMYNLISDYMSRLSPNVLTNIKLFGFERHLYQAHFTDEALSRTPTPYTRLDQLQGKRNTYWTGALFSFAESATIWQKTKDLIDRNFPKKR